jgi:hypothetical protein
MGKKKRSGLSNAVKVRYGAAFGSSTTERSFQLNMSSAYAQAQRQKLRDQVAGAAFLPFFPSLG